MVQNCGHENIMELKRPGMEIEPSFWPLHIWVLLPFTTAKAGHLLSPPTTN